MNLNGYVELCQDLRLFCEDAREPQERGGWSDLLGRAAAFVTGLQGAAYEERRQHLSRACGRLDAREAAAYRKEFAVYEQIKALSDDLKAGAVSCPERMRGQLVWRLNSLYSDCLEVSGKLLAELEKIAPRGPQTVPEKIKAKPVALRLAEAFIQQGYIGTDYRPKEGLTKAEMALIGRELGRKCGYGWIARVADYWSVKGINGRVLSGEAGKADLQKKNSKLLKIKEIIKNIEQ